uniref:Uncharacterized protein n=1 Tax=Romanomermis culicivorax TaxID=13658 RepID=A0A915L7R9_ROMCU
MLPPSTSHTECGKTPSERTTHRREQCNQQKARKTTGQTSSQTNTAAESHDHKKSSAGQSTAECPPPNQRVTVPLTSLIPMRTVIKKKPNNRTLQVATAVNTNAVPMHHRTAPKENKCARCTLPVFTKRVQCQNPETLGSLEKSTKTGVQGSTTTTASDGCGTSHVIFNGATAYGHVTVAHGPDIHPGNYLNTHHVAAAYGPNIGSNHYTRLTIIGCQDSTGTGSSPVNWYRTLFQTTFVE